MTEPIQNDDQAGAPGAAGAAETAGGTAAVEGAGRAEAAGAAAEAAGAEATVRGAAAAGPTAAARSAASAGTTAPAGEATSAEAPLAAGGAASAGAREVVGAGAAAGADAVGGGAGATEAGAIEGYERAVPGGWGDYPLDDLEIRDERRTAEDVVRRIDRGRFILDPDFQRDFVWSEQKQSRLIESILMRIPLPVFYLAEDAEGRLIVVDGRQRLTALQRFLTGQLKLALPDRPELDGKVFGELEVRLQNRVEDCSLVFYIMDHTVPERARLDIFERVNGGEVLTRQQMRNAIYSGPATEFLKDEAQAALFRTATGGSLDAGTMQDREFVNRFCAFALLDLASYRGDMDDWLARGLVRLGELPEDDRRGLGDKFRRGLRNNLAVFGPRAFRRHRTAGDPPRAINAALFDAMMRPLAERSDDAVAAHAAALREAFYQRMADPRFVQAITSGVDAPDAVRARFEIAARMCQEVFDAA